MSIKCRHCLSSTAFQSKQQKQIVRALALLSLFQSNKSLIETLNWRANSTANQLTSPNLHQLELANQEEENIVVW